MTQAKQLLIDSVVIGIGVTVGMTIATFGYSIGKATLTVFAGLLGIV